MNLVYFPRLKLGKHACIQNCVCSCAVANATEARAAAQMLGAG